MFVFKLTDTENTFKEIYDSFSSNIKTLLLRNNKLAVHERNLLVINKKRR